MTKTCLLCMAINRIKLLKEIKMIDTFYDIEIIPKDKDSLELILNLTLYDYDYQEYLKDYFLLNPNNDLKN